MFKKVFQNLLYLGLSGCECSHSFILAFAVPWMCAEPVPNVPVEPAPPPATISPASSPVPAPAPVPASATEPKTPSRPASPQDMPTLSANGEL